MTERPESPALATHEHVTGEFLVTSECNMACSYCIARELPRATFGIEDCRKAVDLFTWLAQGAKSAEITLTGGEPFLVVPVVEQLIQHAKATTQANGITATFVVKTNGTILSEALTDFLREHAVKVVVSIDGPAGVHDRHRVTKAHTPTNSIVLRNLKTLLECDVNCVASLTVHPDACDALCESVRELHDTGIKHIDVGPAYGTVTWSDKQTSTLVESVLEIARFMCDVRLAGGRLEVGPMYRESEHVGGVLKDTWGCHAASSNIAFMPNGQIAGCSSLAMLATRYPDLVIGDVTSGINEDCAAHVIALAQAALDLRKDCQGCDSSRNCTGGCLAINLSQNGAPFSPPPFYCRTISAIPAAWRLAWDDPSGCFALRSDDMKLSNQRLNRTVAPRGRGATSG